MKRIIILLNILVICFLWGCSLDSNATNVNIQEDSYYIGYENGYDEGYENGYNDAFEKSLDEPSYSEEYRSFNKTIANLMYDGEYETVRTFMSYYPDGVNEALEFEFGVTDINVIIDYLENEYNNNPPKINKTQ